MLIKIIILLLLLVVIINLFHALWVMMHTEPQGRKMSHYLGRRLLFSLAVILLLLLALAMGWITPNPSPV